jgi:hypothetical protein
MARTPRIASRRLPDSVRRRLEVATAMAWESLVETHVAHAGQFVTLFSERLSLDEALTRYLVEMDVGDSVGTAVRTRVLVGIEEANRTGDGRAPPTLPTSHPQEGEIEGWRRFRPDVVVREIVQRQRREDEVEAWIKLAIARAEEGVMTTHVENAITFAALLEDYLPTDRSVQHYLDATTLAGGRAQAIYQRTMARLADVHLPLPMPVRRPAQG